MAETSKNKIYYNDDENSVADVLTDMKKMAESTDKAIENSKYNDAQIKKDISNAKKEQALKDAEQDNKIIELQNEKAQLEKELKEAQEDFYQNSIRGQASGEYIHVEDSSNCRAKIGIGGNQKQETREGYNQLKNEGTTQTLNNVTITKKEDETLVVNGTATEDFTFSIKRNIELEDGEQYKLSGCPNGGDEKKYALTINQYYENQSHFGQDYGDGVNFTYNGSLPINNNIYIRLFKGITYNNLIFKPMIVKGTEQKPYEQYGASPSPDYRSEVKSVGSNVNIYDKETMPLKSGLWIGSTPDSNITTNSRGNYVVVPIVGGKTYTISKKNATGTIYATTIASNAENGVKVIDRWDGNSGLKSYTIKTSSTAKYLFVGLFAGTPSEEEKEKYIEELKVEKGTVATPYSKYGQGCVKITKCNKNLFDKDNAIKEYELDGTTGKIMSNSLYFTSDYIRVNPNEQYYLSGKNTGNSNCFYNKDKKLISKINLENGLLTVPDDLNIYYLRINSRLTAIDTTMLEKNTKKSAYEEHQEQSYIMPTQQSMKSTEDIRDTFIKKDGKWYERHNINRRIFDGTTNKFVRTSGTANNLFVTNTFEDGNIIVPSTYGENVQHFNNYFQTNYSSDGLFANGQYVGSAIRPTDDMVMGFGKESEINTVDEANAWLKAKYDAGAPLYVDYLLETPIDIECTEEQSKILDELNNARTYKNVTNITTDSKAILSLDYAKDQETQNQKMQNEIDEIKQLLSTTQTSALLLDNMQTDIESEVK